MFHSRMPPIFQEFEGQVGPGKTLVAVEVIGLVTEQASAGSCELDGLGETAMQRHEDSLTSTFLNTMEEEIGA